MKHSPDNIPLVQPLIELLGSAEKFGTDFDRPGDVEHLNETLANVRSLKDRLQEAVRVLSEITRAAGESGTDVHHDSLTSGLFLIELTHDLDTIERQITNRMMGKAA